MITFVAASPPLYYGLHTDTKPTQNIKNGACFLEMDTSTIYFFDEESNTWQEWGS